MAGKRTTRRRATVVLVTGFEPFGEIADNPSELIARALDGHRLAGARIVARVLPVSLTRIESAVRDALHATRPDLVLALGVARATRAVRIERRAVNRADFVVPDNDGAQAIESVLDPTGPSSRTTRLPLKRLGRAVRQARIAARHSHDAGAYLCNAGYYALLGRRTPCVLLHLPPLGVMPLRAQRRAVDAILSAIVSYAGGRGPSG